MVFQMLAEALKTVTLDRGNIYNGTKVVSYLWNRTYQGMQYRFGIVEIIVWDLFVFH